MQDRVFTVSKATAEIFLQKNTFTVTASELRTPKPEVNYEKIKFVQEDPLGCTTDASVDDSPSPVASIPETHPQSAPIDSAVVIAGDRKDSDGKDNRIDLGGHYGDGGSIHHDTLDLSHWGGGLRISPDGTPHQDKDDAVQGLLALGSTAGPNGVIPESTNLSLLNPNVALSSLMNSQPPEAKEIALQAVPIGILDNPGHTSITELSTSIMTSTGIEPEARKLELLRHYRYHVATWLDICDLRHPFGINVIQMATSSEKLLSAILALSESCIIQRRHWNRAGLEQPTLRKSNQLDQLDHDHPDFTELIVLCLLEEIRGLVTDVPKAWIDWMNRDVPYVNHLVQHAYSKDIESTAYWMFLRIDLGVALANDIPLRIPLPMLPIPSLSLLSRTEDSPVLSPLWHAYRICGIALNNDTREGWDPCLLASLLLAAKHMTHESQQQEILQGFNHIREITGWDTGEYLSHLREEWSFLDGI
ncbi:hypothetical protein BDV33DRAFT_190411 [Aspergillus novoparasiticus]|uniref:Fungal-specific transcription factor domain-containing protein n=1 Tax=Aspergillus novoparasiticus TaxID=986946 RepID=A0A5N6EXT1_9EURO|nr:hypothetical protein BDV33DRAFT_190411 [Aspergillus novoparasiticus]